MIKSKIKTKIIPFLGISVLLLLSMLCSTADVLGQHASTAAAKFEPTKEKPTEYGVIVPPPNMMATTSIYGSNQGYFQLLEWDSSEVADEVVNITGKDISLAYPWYFDTTLDSTTENGMIDPYSDINWVNVSALEVENETISPYYLKNVWNSYSMTDGGSLEVPLNSSIPLEINISIASTGPKILKLDRKSATSFMWDFDLIAPSGNKMDLDKHPIKRKGITDDNVHDLLEYSEDVLFSYVPFVAHETGTFRLLVKASSIINMAYLNIEFANLDISELSSDDSLFVGNEEPTSIQDQWEDEIDVKWVRINGKQGETILIDTIREYGVLPFTHIWRPHKSGYNRSILNTGTEGIYFPVDGQAYLSFIDRMNGENYRATIGSRSVPIVQHKVGGNVTLAKVSRYQMKAINFSVKEDSFVILNYTSWGNGEASISSEGTPNGLLYKNSKAMEGYATISPLKTVTVNDMDFLYYYLPEGEYQTFVQNQNIGSEGLIQLTSRYIEYKNGTVPINDLSYPNKYASSFETVTFNPNEANYTLKDAQWLTLNITEPGQYRFNTTLIAAQNPGCSLETSPEFLYVYNATDDDYYGFDYPNLTYFLNDDDYIYIGMRCKYTGLLVNLSTTGVGSFQFQFYRPGFGWVNDPSAYDDGTNDLQQNGTIEFDTTDPTFKDLWDKGRDPTVDIESLDNETESQLYWVRLDPTSTYSALPNITKITILNSTIEGDIDIAILKDSEYDYDDTWEISESDNDDLDIDGIQTTRDETNWEDNYLGYDSEASFFLTGGLGRGYTIGLEEGLYKVLIIPNGWCYPGNIVANFAVENYWPYGEYAHYNIPKISPEDPLLYAYEIDRFDTLNYGNDQFLTPYTWVRHINYTENLWNVTDGVNTNDKGYLIVKCFGDAYQWTQLVVYSEFVNNSKLYLMQDLPWISNDDSNDEIVELADNVENNSVYEFGVFEDEWYLLFEYDNVENNETLTFRLSLRQYNTTSVLMGSAASSSSPTSAPASGGAGNLLIGGLIIGGAAAVVIGVVYVIMRKKGGRVFSKTPG